MWSLCLVVELVVVWSLRQEVVLRVVSVERLRRWRVCAALCWVIEPGSQGG
jgi:hypothetical protein